MAILPQTYAVPTMPSGNSVSSALELPGTYLYMYLEVPTMSVGYTASTPIYIRGSSDGTTFRRVTNTDTTTNTLVIGVTDLIIASSVSQRFVPLNNFAFRYLQLEVSGTATGANATPLPFKVVCVSNQ